MAKGARDASCRALAPLVGMLERDGHDVRVLVDGLEVELHTLRDPSKWVDWDTLCEVMARAHFTPKGNHLVARRVLAWLMRRPGLLTVPGR